MSNRKKRRVNRQQIFFLILVLIGLVLGGYLYQQQKLTANLRPAVITNATAKKKIDLQLEIADTPEKRQVGLMSRTSLPEKQGMLFKFDREELQTMWMKNTLISLDMVFLDNSLKIVGFLENVPILNLTQRRIDRPARYVLELPAGSVQKLPLAIGDQLNIDNS